MSMSGRDMCNWEEEFAKLPAGGSLLGVDPGTVRVGIAINVMSIVLPLRYFDAEPRQRLIEQICETALERNCVGIVVGLPLNMDGSESASTTMARKLAAELEAITNLPVAFGDERLTSYAAEDALIGHLSSRKSKKRIDAIAARNMLESFLQDRALWLKRKARERESIDPV